MLFLAFPIYKSSWRPRNIFCRQQNCSCLCISLVESSFRVCGTFARLTICNEAVITSNNPAQQTQPDYYYTVVQWSWKGILEYYTNFNTNFSCLCSKKKGVARFAFKVWNEDRFLWIFIFSTNRFLGIVLNWDSRVFQGSREWLEVSNV